MTDNNNLQSFLDQMSSYSDDAASGNNAPRAAVAIPSIGHVVEIAGSGSRVMMHADRLAHLMDNADMSIAMSGQVGSQIKMKVGSSWLVANVRTLCAGEDGSVIANVDFLGEGGQQANGNLAGFRRGVTRYPIPGCEILPVTTEDMRAIFAADDSAHIQIGTVYPTEDIRGTLYVDPMLSKHFAILGSTGTGKSTSVALILHRISELSPEGQTLADVRDGKQSGRRGPRDGECGNAPRQRALRHHG